MAIVWYVSFFDHHTPFFSVVVVMCRPGGVRRDGEVAERLFREASQHELVTGPPLYCTLIKYGQRYLSTEEGVHLLLNGFEKGVCLQATGRFASHMLVIDGVATHYQLLDSRIVLQRNQE